VLSPQWCILLNAGFRTCSYLLLLTVKNIQAVEVNPASAVKEEHIPLRKMWSEGWSFIWRSRLLLNTMLFGVVGALAIQMIDFQFTSLFRLIAPDKESLLGWLVAASGAGALLSIMAMNKINRGAGYGWKLGTGYALIGAAFGGLGLLQPGVSITPVLLLGFVLGVGNGMFIITFNYCLQKETPPHMTGRIFGIQSTILSGVMIGAPLLGGLLVQNAGPNRIFMIFGIVIAVIGGVGLLFGRVLWPVEKEDKVSSEVPF
jgi:DHA3 family macrolide efflux protein-like MFS transporter